ncbi:UreD-domain-containing protein [Dacryopinax primogenitus]|uniref:UreD-domain-containing protein n=1 Tax=Dacryopinax primogenitus (strain DJM 731) TaxID=1858805 RepID=M5G912_DACPD|nr:UreD-domain-containing protein [Dacryopinax primogenitus]EJU02362.1 UreD-domain-containing protein [Dacryopinax primogenitus]
MPERRACPTSTSASFSELSYSYPLKLLSPPSHADAPGPVRIVYVLSYGGGLVGGDKIELDVEVQEGARLVLLTQGSTKVFRARDPSNRTQQHLHANVHAHSLLLLLPDPITPYAESYYSQVQTFTLHPSASAIILDWFTSGRAARGEVWALGKYRSANEVFVQGKRVVRDVLLLEQGELGRRMQPYACYANVFLFGPLVQGVLRALKERYEKIEQMQRSKPDEFVWSLSILGKAEKGRNGEGGDGAVVRCTGRETEMVRLWLKDALSGASEVVGRDVYDKAFV